MECNNARESTDKTCYACARLAGPGTRDRMDKLALTVAHYFASDEPTDEEAKENSDKRSSGKLKVHVLTQ